LQLDVLDTMHNPRLVAMDTMNFWIQGDLPFLKKVLQRVDLLFLNDEEARQLSGKYSLPSAAHEILTMGPNALIIKKGEHGCIAFIGDSLYLAPAYLLNDIEDPTGAGDTFAGGVMAALTAQSEFSIKSLRWAVILGTVLASFGVQGFGVERLINLTTDEVEQRLNQYLQWTGLQETPPC
jgi:sugar/nucleoside kinase (ribokinase family)